MKVQGTTKVIKKEDRLCMKSPTLEGSCVDCVFQIQSPICGVNFSNNILIPQIRLKMTEIVNAFVNCKTF